MFVEQSMSSDLWGVYGVGVLRVWQQVDVKAKRNVTHSWDLVLGWSAGIQQARGGVFKLLHGEEANTLHEGPFNLPNKAKYGPMNTENLKNSIRSAKLTHKPARCPLTGSDFSRCQQPDLPSTSADKRKDGQNVVGSVMCFQKWPGSGSSDPVFSS